MNSHSLQSLEAALAHHNLGSYEESLKYLETAKVQLYESERDKILQKKRQERKKLLSTDKPETLDTTTNIKIEVLDSEVIVPFDVTFYILACKGNVYQSCGDDEQSLLQYLSAWETAMIGQHRDWEILFINSIGLLAYYNLHFELALKCFTKVCKYRERVRQYCVSTHSRCRNMVLGVLILLLHGIIRDVVCIVFPVKEWRKFYLNDHEMSFTNVWDLVIHDL